MITKTTLVVSVPNLFHVLQPTRENKAPSTVESTGKHFLLEESISSEAQRPLTYSLLHCKK